MRLNRLPGIRPRQSLGRAARHGGAARLSRLPRPRCCCCCSAAPFGVPGQAELQASVALACVFFWSLFRPASMPPPWCSLLGLLADLLGSRRPAWAC